MNKSYEIGFEHGNSGNGTNGYRPGNRKVGGESFTQYNAGFDAGRSAHPRSHPQAARTTRLAEQAEEGHPWPPPRVTQPARLRPGTFWNQNDQPSQSRLAFSLVNRPGNCHSHAPRRLGVQVLTGC